MKYVHIVGVFLFLVLWTFYHTQWFLAASLLFLIAALFDNGDLARLHRKVDKNDQ
jgi:phosphatidylglycerophosphate synthase